MLSLTASSSRLRSALYGAADLSILVIAWEVVGKPERFERGGADYGGLADPQQYALSGSRARSFSVLIQSDPQN